MELRPETDGDQVEIRGVHRDAFSLDGRPHQVPPEVALVDHLRDSEDWLPALSVVAAVEGEIVGHVMCTRADVDSEPVVALGPLGVRVAFQHRGIGSTLMESVITIADEEREPLIGLLGSPTFYRRFGFVPSSSLGIEPLNPDWKEHFQIRTLSTYDPTLVGRFRYAEAFDSV